MKPELLRFINLLKSVPEVKESVEELRFGCLVQFNEWAFLKFAAMWGRFVWLVLDNGKLHQEWDNIFKENYKIIWLAHEGNLRMFMNRFSDEFYLEEGYDWREVEMQMTREFRISCNWQLCRVSDCDDEVDIVKLDNTKDLMNQDESFYKEFCDFAEKELLQSEDNIW